MRFFPAEPDIATIFNRIVDRDIDLQPDFQRGEVWTIKKQQRLIDSILRGWVIPPILTVSSKSGQQVLDGQQRLVSIRDFKLNKFPIDGDIEPCDAFIKSLDGIRYQSLPTDIAKAFDRTTIRIYEITDYLPEEPAEIFFRLNQPTTLTSAEKRNAFYGPVRDQIRELVNEFESYEHLMPVLGFTNSRMAYDDVFARVACTIELSTLHKKVTAAAVNEMYRRTTPLGVHVLSRLKDVLQLAAEVLTNCSNSPRSIYETNPRPSSRPRLNKATFFSWLLFFARIESKFQVKEIIDFFDYFESMRSGYFYESKPIDEFVRWHKYSIEGAPSGLIPVYTDRATARVADVSSILLRDLILWIFWYEFSGGQSTECIDPAYKEISRYRSIYSMTPVEFIDHELLTFIDRIQWGSRV